MAAPSGDSSALLGMEEECKGGEAMIMAPGEKPPRPSLSARRIAMGVGLAALGLALSTFGLCLAAQGTPRLGTSAAAGELSTIGLQSGGCNRKTKTVTWGKNKKMRVYYCGGWKGSRNAVIMLHGSGNNIDSMAGLYSAPIIGAGHVAIAINNGNPCPANVKSAMNFLASTKKLPVNIKKKFGLVGYSAGGICAVAAGIANPGRVGGVVAVGAIQWSSARQANKNSPAMLAISCGKDDGQAMYKTFKKKLKPGNIKFIQYQGCDHVSYRKKKDQFLPKIKLFLKNRVKR